MLRPATLDEVVLRRTFEGCRHRGALRVVQKIKLALINSLLLQRDTKGGSDGRVFIAAVAFDPKRTYYRFPLLFLMTAFSNVCRLASNKSSDSQSLLKEHPRKEAPVRTSRK